MPTDETTTNPTARLRELQHGATQAEALAFFDARPALDVEQVLGSWLGSELPTGNVFDGMLSGVGWRGKEFRGTDDVDPLVFEGRRGGFAVNPALVPLGLTVRFSRLLSRPAVKKAARPLLGLMRTRKPAARLRMVEFRGVLSATMVYDDLPINDHFRQVDEDTLIGCMDMRTLPEPYLFVLRREVHPAARFGRLHDRQR